MMVAISTTLFFFDYGWWLVRFYPGLRIGRKAKTAQEGNVMPGGNRLMGVWDFVGIFT